MMTEAQRDCAIELLAAQSQGKEVTMRTILAECEARDILDADPIRLLLLQEAPEAQWAAALHRKVLVRTGEHVQLDTPEQKLVAADTPGLKEALNLWSQASGAKVINL